MYFYVYEHIRTMQKVVNRCRRSRHVFTAQCDEGRPIDTETGTGSPDVHHKNDWFQGRGERKVLIG